MIRELIRQARAAGWVHLVYSVNTAWCEHVWERGGDRVAYEPGTRQLVISRREPMPPVAAGLWRTRFAGIVEHAEIVPALLALYGLTAKGPRPLPAGVERTYAGVGRRLRAMDGTR